MTRLLLVTTCGTSLLTNRKPEQPEGSTSTLPDLDWVGHDGKWIHENANAIEIDEDRLTPLVENRKDWLRQSGIAVQRKLSAELNGIIGALDRYKPQEVSHVLVHTDTALGELTAKLIRDHLESSRSVSYRNTVLLSASGLRTDDLASFRDALAELTNSLVDTVENWRDQKWGVVFNLTGGFKSINAYLQTLGMVLADRCVFVYEGSTEILEIPRLPIRWAELDELRDNLEFFRRDHVKYPLNSRQFQGVPESLTMEVDGQITTSMLGAILWKRYRPQLFSERLLEPLSPRIRISDSIHKVFGGLAMTNRIQLNEAFDEFSAWMDHDRQLPNSRRFKQLKGKPRPGSTHELYAWQDGMAGRLQGHFDGQGNFVFDHLEPHLK